MSSRYQEEIEQQEEKKNDPGKPRHPKSKRSKKLRQRRKELWGWHNVAVDKLKRLAKNMGVRYG